MGIPRLSQDLREYCERVAVGTSPPATPETVAIKHLIIDGPSLVYHVYDNLLAYKSANAPLYPTLLPTYHEINRGVRYLLSDLEDDGAHIKHIFFDGALPTSKREVRLERMERLCYQLNAYRTSHTNFPSEGTASAEIRDFEHALWQRVSMWRREVIPPPPQFMVASVIEDLSSPKCPWRDRWEVVPDEAEIFCAVAAQKSTESVAILTNDSDLAVHDLGYHGRVAFIQSLEKESPMPGQRHTRLTALMLNPSQTAARMNIRSLLNLGFERSLDPHASLAIIQERTRNSSRRKNLHLEYDAFVEDFLPFRQCRLYGDLELLYFDPRIAEIAVTLDNEGESANFYLAPLLEDPQRDSSWSYGTKIRQLGYFMLMCMVSREFNSGDDVAITEYARKGPRTASSPIHTLSRPAFVARAAELQRLLTVYLQPGGRSLRTDKADCLLSYHLLALSIICESRLSFGKPTPSLSEILQLFGINYQISPAPQTPTRPSWSEVHLLASMHAVLYSLRMLKQIASYTVRQIRVRAAEESNMTTSFPPPSSPNAELLVIASNLDRILSGMPPIAGLFVDIPNLQQQLREMDPTVREAMMSRLRGKPTSNEQPDTDMQRTKARDTGRTADEDDPRSASASRRKRTRDHQLKTRTAQEQRANRFTHLSDKAE